MKKGGYEYGYKKCECFWGSEPGSLVKILNKIKTDYTGSKILDLGAGEGKNALFYALNGAKVDAVEISKTAIKNGKRKTASESINWINKDILSLEIEDEEYDVVIAYGVSHCMNSVNQVNKLFELIKKSTKKDGFIIFCAFNDRDHDFSGHPDSFNPILLSHDFYTKKLDDYEIVYLSDELLYESHPHNNISHYHSMTRIIARK